MGYKYCVLAVLVVLVACRVHGDVACEHEPNEHDYCYDATCGLPITNPNVYHPCECTQENIGYEFTECNTTSNTRNLVYYWKPPATCHGGVLLPNHMDNVPCSVTCGPGQHLDVSTHTCAGCSAGTYSPGGGMVWDTWDTLPAQFETECAVGSLTKTCTPWRPRGNIIDSGNQSTTLNAQMESVLSLQFHLIVPGSIKFTYKVSAEAGWDYLMFVVNDLVYLQKSNANWTTYSQNLPIGYHVVEWVYFKDESVSAGEDKATIQNITITGLTVADLECRPCPAGKFSSSGNAAECHDCPANTYSIGNATTCTPCPAGQTSYPSSSSCTGHTNCTEEDYTYTLSACIAGSQLKTYRWITPAACMTAYGTLPDPVQVSCGPLQCPPGTSLSPNGTACVYCADGTANAEPSATGCTFCPMAQYSGARIAYFDQWDVWYPNFTTGCTGDCLSDGWRLGSYFIDSGAGAGPGASTWVEFSIAAVGAPSVTFNYSLACSAHDTALFFYVNDSIVHQQPCSSCNSGWASYTANLAAGVSTVKLTYHKGVQSGVDTTCDRALVYEITVSGVKAGMGGAADCFSCVAGTHSGGNGDPVCAECPGGTFTPGGNSVSCTTCPSNTYAHPGSSQCYACPHATTSAPGSEGCTYDCSHLLESILLDAQSNLNITDVYDITGLATNYSVPDSTNSKLFYLNLCVPRATPCDENGTTFACVAEFDAQPMNIGDAIGFYPSSTSNKGLVVAFTNPVTNCAVNISLQCNQNSTIGQPIYNSNASDPEHCRYNFIFANNLACPLCAPDDYFEIQSPCIGGKITKSYHWNDPKNCHDGELLPVSTYTTCSSSEETVPIKQSTVVGIVLGVGGFVILAAAGLAYLYISRRRVQAEYSALKSRPMGSLAPSEPTNEPGSPAYSLE